MRSRATSASLPPHITNPAERRPSTREDAVLLVPASNHLLPSLARYDVECHEQREHYWSDDQEDDVEGNHRAQGEDNEGLSKHCARCQ